MKTNRPIELLCAAALCVVFAPPVIAQTPPATNPPAASTAAPGAAGTGTRGAGGAPAAAAPAGARAGRPSAADTEVWEPQPNKVTPAKLAPSEPPSDAIVLFDGTNTDEWVNTTNKQPVSWTVADGVLTVNKNVRSNIETKRTFRDYQLHLEWRIPAGISGNGQNRGNSGVFLASTGAGDAGYEIQILDSHENRTYANGMAASIYKQFIPLANPSRPPGEWNAYDINWTAPTFQEDGALKTPARVTVYFNGVLVQNNVELKGETVFVGPPSYKKYDTAPIKLQTHGDPSQPISFRNIWIRSLAP